MPTPRRPHPQHCLCLALLLPAALSEANPLHGSLQTQWHSRYVSEGRDNLDGHSLHSLGGDLTKDHGALGVWQAWGAGSSGYRFPSPDVRSSRSTLLTKRVRRVRRAEE